MTLLKVYNYFSILVRKVISLLYTGEKQLPLLYCNFKKILYKNFPESSRFNFIQVGAFDGISHDILYDFVKKRNCKGVVIEPIEEYFALLSKNYAFNENIVPVKLAVHSSLKEIPLYRVSTESLDKLPDWAAGITSIDPSHHLKTNIPSEAIIVTQVRAMSLMEIVAKHYSEKDINLFQADTEGYDFEILKSFDFEKFTPDIIKIEYVNLNPVDVNNCIQILRNQGYYCLYEQGDLIGIQLSKVRL